MRTVLLTGAAGNLGVWLRRRKPRDVRIVSIVHRRPVDGESVAVDLRDGAVVARAVDRIRPDVVVHAAYAKDAASVVDATANVADVVAAIGGSLVFTSTEAVFAGDGVARDEAASPDPVWDYGRWKAEAEEIVARTVPDAAIVRLPLLCSLDPPDDLVATMRAAAGGAEPATWFTDEVRQAAPTADVADALWRIAALEPAGRTGCWHLPGPERLTRPELAERAARAAGLDVPIVRAPTPSGLVRPADLHLTGARAEREIGWSPRTVYVSVPPVPG